MITKKYIEFQNRLADLRDGEDEGAAMVEYGLLVAGIAMASILVVFVLGGAIRDMFQAIADAL